MSLLMDSRKRKTYLQNNIAFPLVPAHTFTNLKTMNIYQEQIMEHFHNPSHHGTLTMPTHTCSANNPTCGDKIHIDMKVADDVITEIAFNGEGCAISQAAASMLCEQIAQKPTTALQKMSPDDITQMLGVSLSPNRLKCALLSLEVAQKTLAHPVHK